MKSFFQYVITASILTASAQAAHAEYLNDSNMTVTVGPSTSTNPFENRTTADSLASIIDAPSANVSELHNQQTHIWVVGEPLELIFELQSEYNLTTFHFWNYTAEGYDVDNIDLNFYDAANILVGSLLNISPAVSNSPILSEDFSLTSITDVKTINAVLTGSNNQVDFNNIGFTGTAIPEPTSIILLGLPLLYFVSRNKD